MNIEKDRCKGCMLCIQVCPHKLLELSKKLNKRGTQYVVLKDREKCANCGLCAVMCPDCAISYHDET